MKTNECMTMDLVLILRSFHYCNVDFIFCRPHPKDREGTVFTGVFLSTEEGESQVRRGYPSARSGPGWGYPGEVRWGYSPWRGQDGGTLPRSGGGYPGQQ